MNKREEAMLIVTIFLLVLLVGKSLWLDPVKNLDEEMSHYKNYVLDIAPLKNTGLFEKMGILTYKVVSVVKEKEEGQTDIMYEDISTKEWGKKTLQGEYRAKVRAYLLGFIPVKDINIKGGIQEWRQP